MRSTRTTEITKNGHCGLRYLPLLLLAIAFFVEMKAFIPLIVMHTIWNCRVTVWYNCSGAATLHRSGITLLNLAVWEVRQTTGPTLATVHNTLCLDACRSPIPTSRHQRVSFMNMFVASPTLVNESVFCFCFTGKLSYMEKIKHCKWTENAFPAELILVCWQLACWWHSHKSGSFCYFLPDYLQSDRDNTKLYCWSQVPVCVWRTRSHSLAGSQNCIISLARPVL